MLCDTLTIFYRYYISLLSWNTTVIDIYVDIFNFDIINVMHLSVEYDIVISCMISSNIYIIVVFKVKKRIISNLLKVRITLKYTYSSSSKLIELLETILLTSKYKNDAVKKYIIIICLCQHIHLIYLDI